MNTEPMYEESAGQLVRSELYRATKMAEKLFDLISDNDNLEPWVLSKVVRASDYLDAVHNYIEYQTKFVDGESNDLSEPSLGSQIEDEMSSLEMPDDTTGMDDLDTGDLDIDVSIDDFDDDDDDEIKKESAYDAKLDAILESINTHDEIKDKIMRSIRINGVEKTINNVKAMISGNKISESEARVCLTLLKEAASCKKEAKARKEKRKVVVKPKKDKVEKPKAYKKPVGDQLDEQVIAESTDLQDILRLAGQKQLNG